MLRNPNNNMFSLMEMFSQNYAKAYRDYCETSHGLMPFMQTERTPSGKSGTTSAGVAEFPYMNWADPSKWQGMTGLPQQAMLSQIMSMFSGDKNISAAMQRHLNRKDAMNVESWMELMPILLMLSYGNMLKNYLAGPQRTMMEAYLQGFAKGCPELHQDTDAARNPILDAQEALWSQMMPLENPMLEFWTNALQGTSSASGDQNEAPEESKAQNTRAKKSSSPENGSGPRAHQSNVKESPVSSLSGGLAAMQQAQGEAWQQYCNVFWPTRSHR
ncbi:hypothetical protein [Pseudovibrio sp. Ad37]|uniref:hypothetical protein n=1 Tax=Pseudovibrio sp. Ad37 TaxID=989422 RepID=UPI0007B235D3|nr:hypothetical protein [Pseudovibrio sp. Ad37]KZL27599.1 hypothetical protein PsAD37_01274 [Pseudovibrio sp. Ad37]